MAELIPYDEAVAPASVPQGQLIPYGETGQLPPTVAPAPKARTFTENLKRQIGLFARQSIEGVTGGTGAIADAATGLSNGLFGTNLPMPSKAQSEMLTRLGLPQEENPTESVVGFVTRAGMGSLDPVLQGVGKAVQGMVPQGFKTEQETLKSIADELRAKGYHIAPSEGGNGKLARLIEGVSGTKQTKDLMRSTTNETVTQNITREALQLPPTAPLTRDVLENQAQRLVTEGYDPIKRIPNIPVGAAYRRDLAKIVTDLGKSQSFPLAEKPEVEKEVGSYLFRDNGRFIQNFTGEDAVKHIRLLREAAKANFQNGGQKEAEIGRAQVRIAKAIEDQIERSLSAPGAGLNAQEMLSTFRETRKMLAKNNAVQKMLTDPFTGTVNPTKAAAQAAKGAPLSDGLDIIAKGGAPRFRGSIGAPTTDPTFVSNSDYIGGGLGAGIGSLTHGSTGMLFGGAGVPAIRTFARSALASNPGQRLLAMPPTLSSPAMQIPKAQAARMLAPNLMYLDPMYSGE